MVNRAGLCWTLTKILPRNHRRVGLKSHIATFPNPGAGSSLLTPFLTRVCPPISQKPQRGTALWPFFGSLFNPSDLCRSENFPLFKPSLPLLSQSLLLVCRSRGCRRDTALEGAVDCPLEHGMRTSRAVCGEGYHITRV